MEFRVLGPLEVLDEGGQPVALGSGRQPLLLACLLLDANEVISRDRLIEALWGERPQKTARNALQVQIHALRRRIGTERITTEGPGYRLRVESGELDLERFERLVALGRSRVAAGDAKAGASNLGEALGLWRGAALADVTYEAFAQADIARLEELRLAAVEERVAADLALGRHVELVPELEALVADQPLRERLHGQLMLALYRSGRQTDALGAFRRFRRSLSEELGLEPGPELQELQQAILRQDAALRVEPPELRARRHLPAPQTPLVGRPRELDEVSALLRGSARLVTLTGAGGSGKTRLALQVAHGLADAFPDGVYFVDLAHLHDPALVPTTIAHALGLDERGDEQVTDTVEHHLRARRLLLLLDNFEVVDEAAPLLGGLLESAPGLSLLVTSRTPLRLSAEHEYRVQPLPPAEAVQLFAARARAVAPSFRRASEESDEVAEICRRVDCLPLAIELAAARTREYSPAEMLGLLPGALDLAADGPRDLPERQRTLRAAIDWSHALLDESDQALLARLSVFEGGCTTAAATAVCAAQRIQLAALVASSLLHERIGGDGKLRFSALEAVREYSLEQLEARGEADDVRRRHATYFAGFAESLGDEPPAELEEEHDNLRAAINWSHETGAAELELRLVAALGLFWAVHDHLREGRQRIEAALSQCPDGPAPLRARVLGSGSWIALRLGDYDEAERLAAESRDVYRSLEDEPGIAAALNRLGAAVSGQGDVARAIALQQESAAIYRRLGDDRMLAVLLSNLGYRKLVLGQREESRVLCEEALSLARRIGDPAGLPLPLVNLGLAELSELRYDEALRCFGEGLQVAHELGFVVYTTHCLNGLAAVAVATGEAERATMLAAAADASACATALSLEPFERSLLDRTIESAKLALAQETFAAAWATGQRLTVAEAAAYAPAIEVPVRGNQPN
ncbi:MAG TPA: BTAD domain-containing putative transcriptional regulator [Gaiellaceae bacterium]|nr:BTAD domain-containing putative transcriptional regulator [Gaiellaceae bacterium]